MAEVFIASAARLAVGKLGGSLKDVPEADMGAAVIRAALERAGVDPASVDEVVISQNYRSGKISSNSARVMAVRAGVPLEVPEYTVNKHCGGGLRAVISAAQAIKAGDAGVIVAGGLEQMSSTGFILSGDIRWGASVGNRQLLDPLTMVDPLCGCGMGMTAENVAERWSISREEQDSFAFESQRKAATALAEGRFKDEIVPIEVPAGRGETRWFDTDEHPRPGTTLEALARLKPAFKAGGTVTAGNASGMNDGAAALVLASEEQVTTLGLTPLVRIAGYASVGVDPAVMGTGPVPATRQVLARLGITIEQMDVIELNEAFASMCIYFERELRPRPETLNPNGGAIALGHPIAAAGAVILTKLVYELRRRKGRYGLATMCIGGGQGISLVVEAV